ncbi:TPA: anhydro-N-acetylmuramic acid kinase, partial [Candidatus Bipolaricaulota bacterium]|nr:anhydro-N-acetylmuramic acid kinase [Candidatus Bipolaricaulota bacterium]
EQATSDIDLIGSHGQTVCHLPGGFKATGSFSQPSTLQIGEINVIAERTGITTVGDFRPADIAAKGEGAPLIPYVDWVLFSSPERSRVLLNIGGIANVTYIPAGAGLDEIMAFDTGPGNMVIDRLVQKLSGGKLAYDVNGDMAARGEIDESLLKELMEHPFINRKPPKSTGREEFGDKFSTEILAKAQKKGLNAESLIATVTAFTIESIVKNCRMFLGKFDELIVSGGGARNLTIMRWLAERLRDVKVTTTQEYGIPVEAKEALGFAVLAYQTLKRRPNNVPAATGARRAVVLGKIAWGSRR